MAARRDLPPDPAGVDMSGGRRLRRTGSAAADPVGSRSLAELAAGSRAVVVEVAAASAATTRRLGELGFTPGTVVEVVRRAPLRDPIVYRLKDYEICLRRAQAACIRTAEVG
jgi:ferrous iron transport protein A